MQTVHRIRAILAGFMILNLTATAQPLFTDDFEDGDASGWSKSGGSWSVVTDGSHVYRQGGTSSDARARAGVSSWTDYSVEARIKPLAFNGTDRFVALLARAQSMTSYYYLALRNSGRLELKKLVSGSSTVLAGKSFVVTTGTWYALRIEVQGTSLKAYVDGVLELMATDTQFSAGDVGGATFYASGEFDDFVVTSLSGPPPSPPQAPTGLLASEGDSRVTLRWNASASATSYSLRRSTNSGGPYATLASNITGTSYSDLSVINGTTYFYVVSALNAVGESGNSSQVNATPAVPPDQPGEVVGFASLNGGVTGGAGEQVVTVTSGTELLAYSDSNPPYVIYVSGTITLSGMEHVRSDKTIVGLGADAKIVGGGLYMYGASNIIIRNLTFDGSSEDAIGITTGSRNIWIDHCTLMNASDGLIDITRQSSFVTVSYCVFRNHHKTMLIGHSDSFSADVGFLKVTVHHNWFDGTESRHPRVRFGEVHVFNNYYTANPLYGVASTEEADVLMEGNYFENVPFPSYVGYADSGPGDLVERDNLYVNSGAPQTRGTAFEASAYYTYALDPASEVPQIVMSQAGAQNAPPQPPPSPTGLSAVAGNAQVALNWRASVGATSYRIKRATIDGGPYVSVASNLITTAFTDSGLSNNVRYYYVVSAVNAVGESADSAQVSATPTEQPPPLPANSRLIGFASVNALGQNGTTGGAGGPIVTVSTANEFLDCIARPGPYTIQVSGLIALPGPMHDVTSHKTIIGLGANSGLTGGGLNIGEPINDNITQPPPTAVRNVIIQNLIFTNLPDDAINVQMFAHHVWIDHCDLSRAYDGLIDIKRGADFITVSWNHTHHHSKNMLLGHSDSNGPQDIGHLRVSYHHNWFDATPQRNPRVRFGEPVHVFNNYYYRNSDVGVASQANAGCVVEGNYFEDVEEPMTIHYAGPTGRMVERNNVFAGDSGAPDVGGTVIEPSTYYTYTLDNPADVKSIVIRDAGVGKLRFGPELKIARGKDSLSLQWPAWASNYAAYATTRLSPPIQWKRAANQLTVSNDSWTMRLDPGTNAAMFFRLQAE